MTIKNPFSVYMVQVFLLFFRGGTQCSVVITRLLIFTLYFFIYYILRPRKTWPTFCFSFRFGNCVRKPTLHFVSLRHKAFQ